MKRVDKPWGHEVWFAQTDRYVGKILVIEAGKRLSLQYHEQKDESFYVQEGVLRLTLETDGELTVEDLAPGQARHIPPGTRHRFEAPDQRCVLCEVSTPEVEDVVRLEDDFGRG
jgi:mannose-6-phosphate isomerase-like protein (cupin superfamily)